MRVSSRLLILFIVIAIVFGGFFYMFYHIKHEEMRLYQEADLVQRKITIESIIKINNETQMDQTQNFALCDEMMGYIHNPNSNWPQSMLQRSITSLGYSLVQIYDPQGNSMFSAACEAYPGLALLRLEPSYLDSLAHSQKASFFYDFNHQILSCTISGIHRDDDLQLNNPPAGYLLIAQAWDYSFLGEMATALKYDIRISTEKPEQTKDEEQYNTKIIRPLLGQDRDTVAWLTFYSANPFLNRLRHLGNLILFGTMGFIFIFFLMQYFLIQQWIATPLNQISQSLKQSIPDPIKDLTKGRNEFSDVARLIENFFAQKEELLNEIKERIKTEIQLREMQEQTNKLLLTSPESIIVTKLDGSIIDVNIETLNLLQIPDRDSFLAGNPNIENLIRKTDHDQIQTILSDLNKGSYIKNRDIRFELGPEQGCYIKNRDIPLELIPEQGFPGLLSASVVLDNDGQASKFIFITRDMSDIRNLEQQLRQSQKMESIGTLSGGIAHDFNNIITIIAGYVALASGKIRQPKQAEHDLSAALQACLRAKSLIGKILTFSRQSEQDIEDLCLKNIVEESLPMIRALLPANIKIETKIQSEAYATVDNTELQQVLINLSTNAYHAMRPDGGELRIELDEIPGFRLLGLSKDVDGKGNYLHLSVIDTGCGIAPEIIDRIYDPYFSTKIIGEGTGLGLSIVHGIIASYKGFITVLSVLGEGTNINIYLPVKENPKKKIKVEKAADAPFIPARLLIVDDEPALVDIFREALTDAGYTVDAYTNPLHALDAFVKDPPAYDLVIADINMPDLNGIALGTKMRNIKELPVILYTGFLDSSLQKKLEIAGFRHILNKPIMPDALIKEVKLVIYTEGSAITR
ncbi:MAG: response regulator [Candidatus Cloacimonetes bacterium]|nr:response regulator [Candidatus Cloacimonadota bacterium]MDY0172715.1 response regulator [Candidatus Cloacimonadaceae bacterium]